MKLMKFDNQPVNFIETLLIKEGVECDVYEFVGEEAKDLGIIRVASHSRTPRQKILLGDKTIEGCISGSGRLVVQNSGGGEHFMNFRNRRHQTRSKSKSAKSCSGKPAMSH